MTFRRLFVYATTVWSLFFFAGTPPCRADTRHPIGKIVQVDRSYWGLRIDGGAAERTAAVDEKIYEKDTVQTVANQHLGILLVDGTELVIGPSSRVTFRNWTGRDSDGHCVRAITLLNGIIKAKVRKIYSQAEPFVISNSHGAVAVRGTEFVVEIGFGAVQKRNLSPEEMAIRRSEVEVHTLEGEVHLAKSVDELNDNSERVAILAGQTSLVRDDLARPLPAHAFDPARFSRYLAGFIPNVQLKITKNTTNVERAEMAENTAGKVDTISPAHPEFAKVQDSAPAQPQGRSIASVTSAFDDGHRQSLRGQSSILTPAPPPADQSGLTTDLVRPAILGGDVQVAGSNYDSQTIARQNTGAVQEQLNGGVGLVAGAPPPQTLPPLPPPPQTQAGVRTPSSFPSSRTH